MAPGRIDVSAKPLLHYSARQDAVLWPLESASQAQALGGTASESKRREA